MIIFSLLLLVITSVQLWELRATNIIAMYALANCEIVDKKWVKSSLRKIIDASCLTATITYFTHQPGPKKTLEKIWPKEWSYPVSCNVAKDSAMFFGSYLKGLPQSFKWMCLMMDSQCRGLFPNVIKTSSVFYNQVGLTKTFLENWDSKANLNQSTDRKNGNKNCLTHLAWADFKIKIE